MTNYPMSTCSMVHLRKSLTMALLLAVGSNLNYWVVAPSQAQSKGEEETQPRCTRKGGSTWICVYAADNPAPGAYKSYEGTIASGIPNGRGVIVFENDDRYEGEVRNGVPQGQGMFVFANNDRYEGQMRQGQPNGTGTFTFANGDRYSGGMKDGYPHGRGTFTFSNGDVFVGEFYLGQVKGQGTLTTNCVRCQGVFFSSQFSGRGTCTYPAGSIFKTYTGEFRGGQAEGRGRATLADGTQFSGEFRQGQPFIPGVSPLK
jgi:hypothetical protein